MSCHNQYKVSLSVSTNCCTFPTLLPIPYYLSLHHPLPKGNCLFHTYLLPHNLMALAFWLPFYAAGPNANYGNLWQINIFILRFLQFIAVYFALINSRSRKEMAVQINRWRERERRRQGSIVLFVIFILRGIVDYCPFGSRWRERGAREGGSLDMIFSIYLHKCMKNANSATNKQTDRQTDKQSDNKQSAALSICASSIADSMGNVCIMHDGACTEFKIPKTNTRCGVWCGREKGMGLSVGAEHTLKINRSSSSHCAPFPRTSPPRTPPRSPLCYLRTCVRFGIFFPLFVKSVLNIA